MTIIRKINKAELEIEQNDPLTVPKKLYSFAGPIQGPTQRLRPADPCIKNSTVDH